MERDNLTSRLPVLASLQRKDILTPNNFTALISAIEVGKDCL
ncbi:MAG: hypothetical protein AB8B69_14735 [Chitinophagales bacterium]